MQPSRLTPARRVAAWGPRSAQGHRGRVGRGGYGADALVERAVLMPAARALDIARGDTFMFESEAEMNVLMDYALYEYRVQGKALVEVYREQTTPLSPMQRELLDGMCQSYTSLFRITEVHAAESTLVLADRLQQWADIPLIDIMFSRTVKPGMLLFTRVVPL